MKSGRILALFFLGPALCSVANAQNGCGDTLNWTSSSCQVIGAGQLNTAMVNGANDPNAWTVISRHGEYAQTETECNIPRKVSVSGGVLTIATTNASATCGDWTAAGAVREAPRSFQYSTGAIQWNTFSFQYGTVIIRAALPPYSTQVWPAFWFMPADSSSTPCQTQNKYTGDTNGDGSNPVTGGSCPDSGQTGYQEIDMMEGYNGSNTWPQLAYFSPSTHNCTFNQSPLDSNYHVYSMSWTSSGGLSETLDGNSTGCSFSGTGLNKPMFLIIQTQTSNTTGPPTLSSGESTTLNVDYVKVCDSSITAVQCNAATGPSDATYGSHVIFYDDFNGTGTGPAPPTGLNAVVK